MLCYVTTSFTHSENLRQETNIYIRTKSLQDSQITKESPACPLAKVFGMHGTTTDTFLDDDVT